MATRSVTRPFGLKWFWYAVWALLVISVISISALLEQRASSLASDAQKEAASQPTPNYSGLPVAVFLGDSYTEASQVSEPQSFVAIVSKTFHWDGRNAGQGGTGYVNSGPTATFADRRPIPDRVEAVVALKPNFVIVAAGINDAQSQYSTARVRTAVDETLRSLVSQLPEAKVIIVGPWWPNGYPTSDADRVEGIIRSAAAAYNLPFIDPIGERWITGTNDNTTQPGNRAIYIGPDGTHPNAAGQAYIAKRMSSDLQKFGVRPYSANE